MGLLGVYPGRPMRALVIIVRDPAPDPFRGRARVFEGVEINAFVLERVPQPLDEPIAHPATLAVH